MSDSLSCTLLLITVTGVAGDINEDSFCQLQNLSYFELSVGAFSYVRFVVCAHPGKYKPIASHVPNLMHVT